jgi:hypothetical protein
VSDLHRVGVFRNRLVGYMNTVRQYGGRYGPPPPDDVRATLASEQTWLAQEYGALFNIINRWGGTQMAMPALGITSHDVVQDAIHSTHDVYYDDIGRYTVQHLDTVIGRLSAEADETHDPDRLYVLTSPVFWLGRLVAFLRWVWASTRRRIYAGITLLIVTVIGAVVSGAAQAFVARLLSQP